MFFINYMPVILMFAVAAGFAVANVLLSALFGPYRASAAKMEPYECGAHPVGDARKPVVTRFYRVAMLFLLFDVEVALMLPVLTVYRDYAFKWVAFTELFLFMALLVVGYVYIRGRGGLEWD
ncbi:MAG: NADH-quinone oxidoreductase subunit A [Candidatus Riflebacteria bacterium]|nr:NADH-quinone oxidoreductase subunit A [Candidatus Riflebacteria bacterium]